ncbi:DNA (cytosine-5)-methyltransferase 1 [Loktanella ponticola]|uniref:Cytosine-specific methyltransferase n=1 Tax=Yoonia ponticola TaxID=1524255 RepID=A0A7W9BP63_9RHOB|nr:DNA cytosine methyltransferase [Yoonia ponticola]MBB5724086.1 DNA (cytosine-5)-methyltransferase 1 [Yoonia ponticola]
MHFIDLFAGCGGLSLGLSKAGWKGVFAIEKNEDAFETFSHNFNRKKALRFDWPRWLPKQAISTSELLDDYRAELVTLRGEIDLIAGGPPCQGFSFAGRRKADDPRNKLKDEYLEIVDIIRPKFLVFENVKGFTAKFKNSKKPSHSEQVIKQLEDLSWGGYSTFSSILDASLFGVPQPRPRFILIAVRSDLLQGDVAVMNPMENIAAHAGKFRKRKKLNGHDISVKEAISDLEVSASGTIKSVDTNGFQQIIYRREIESDFQRLLKKDLPSGKSANSLRLAKHRPDTLSKFSEILATCPKGKSLPKEFREKYGIKKQCFTPLHPDEMSKTVTTLPDDLLHYSEPRILTVRECARLQTFPDWFEFLGKYTTGGARRKQECPRYTQVGNAVPPLMAEALGLLISDMQESLDA